MDRPLYLAVDFDDTLCIRTEWGGALRGRANNPVINLVRELKSRGWKIVLWTCRSGKTLEDAVKWCEEFNVPIDFVNENPEAVQWFRDQFNIAINDWSPKIYADVYLDDSAINPMGYFNGVSGIDYSQTDDFATKLEKICNLRIKEKMKKKSS